ncbi:MAG: hypothetical protein HFJ08_05705 [Lachnospiraceae bacterium]|jgi:hypothetical protein|nr:hypothetical protein [Lachnospiraceae bacterium]
MSLEKVGIPYPDFFPIYTPMQRKYAIAWRIGSAQRQDYLMPQRDIDTSQIDELLIDSS